MTADTPTPRLTRTHADWLAILKRNDIRPTRSMGQNFLVEPSVVEHIAEVAEIGAGDRVVEIGPGMGILSRELLGRGVSLTGVELDRDLAKFLREDLAPFGDRFTLVERDARHVDVDLITEGQPYQVVANLPYSVATVVIRHFVEAANNPTRLTVMVQREVAERMTAPPPDLSLLGLATQFYADARIAFIVPKDVFLPPPKVESAVVRMDIRTDFPLTLEQRDHMFALATMAFQRKRKTIANGLSQGLDRPKADIETALSDAGIDPQKRPQALSVDEWTIIARTIAA